MRKEGVRDLRPFVQSQVGSFLKDVSQAPEAALLLDYDGTLAPFDVKRHQASPYPGVEPLLQEIVRNGRTRVVIISGRDAADLLPLIKIHPRPEMWGIHGVQRVREDGSTEMPPLDERTLNGLSEAERWLSYQQLRNTAEFKPGSIAVHWRGLSEKGAHDLSSRVWLGWRPIAEKNGMNLLEFDGGIEIRAPKADKGEAVRTFLRTVDRDTPVAYLGDDSTDESAFRAIEGHGLSLLVRPRWRRTAARGWLKPPEELIEFLVRWIEARNSSREIENGAAAGGNG